MILIVSLQILSGLMTILTGLLSLLIGHIRYKEGRYTFAKLYFSFGYFAFSWFILKWSIPIDPNIELIKLVSGEVIRVLAPSIYTIFLLDMYLDRRDSIVETSEYRGIERRHNT